MSPQRWIISGYQTTLCAVIGPVSSYNRPLLTRQYASLAKKWQVCSEMDKSKPLLSICLSTYSQQTKSRLNRVGFLFAEAKLMAFFINF
jgi:hypothetical protein